MVHMLYISVLNIALPTIFRRLSPSPFFVKKKTNPQTAGRPASPDS